MVIKGRTALIEDTIWDDGVRVEEWLAIMPVSDDI